MIASLIALAPWLAFFVAFSAVLWWHDERDLDTESAEHVDDWHAANVAFYDNRGVTR